MSENKKLINERVIDHMQAKYGDEFIKTFSILGVGGQSPFDEFTDVKGISERYPEKVITIRVYPPDYFGKYPEYEKEELILDDYISTCRAKEIAKVYEKDIVGVYGKYMVKVVGMTGYLNVLPLEIDMNTPPEEIVRNEDVSGMINIFVEDEPKDKDEKARKIFEIYLSKYGRMFIDIIYVKNINDLRTSYHKMSKFVSKNIEKLEVEWETKTDKNDYFWRY